MHERNSGFTLFEIVIGISLMAILAAITIPVHRGFFLKNDLDNSSITVVQSLRRAQDLARGVASDFAWGTRVEPTRVIVFRGTSFASRDASFDEIVTLPATYSLSGVSEVVFSKAMGLPLTTGNIIITNSEGTSATININAKGTISY